MTKAYQRKLERLLHKAAELGRRDVTMPIDIFSLARGFADLPEAASTFAATRTTLLVHRNAFVRRVFFTMARFMEDADLPEADVADAVLVGLGDTSAWVQYDAAWLAKQRRVSAPAVVAKLKALAHGDATGKEIDPGDAEANLRRQAIETLVALGLK